MFLMLFSINWASFIAWVPLPLEIFRMICILIVCEPGYDVINFEINLIFPLKQFLDMTENSRQKFKCLENKKYL